MDTNYHNFEDMKLKENLLRGIFSYGFTKPSEIQEKAIPIILSGSDLIAQSQSGTGKTGAFTISMLNIIDEKVEGCQGMILTPTKELAIQIYDVCKSIGQYLTGVNPVLCVGGEDIRESAAKVNTGSVIIIGTPGRIIDMADRKIIKLGWMKLLILDEADELLKSNFSDQVRKIITNINENTQICIFSATFPDSVLELTKHFMNNPQELLIKTSNITLDGIKQFYIDVGYDNHKFETFCDIYSMISVSQSIVYVNSKARADELKRWLEDKNFTVSVIHGRMFSYERNNIMREFRNGKTRILISTDLLSRGIDIQQVSVVINYELPLSQNKDVYIHRIGRSGRYGRKGVAINLVSRKDMYKIRELEKYYTTIIEPMPENLDKYL